VRLALLSCVFGGSRLNSQTFVTIGATKDNTLIENAVGSLSNGAGQHFFAGRSSQFSGSIRRGLVAFDVAGTLPAGATVISASLTLSMSRTRLSNTEVMSLHRALSDWGQGTSAAGGQEGGGAPSTPGDATWIHTFFDGSLWTTPGGDFSSTPSASRTVGGIGSYVWGSTSGMVADLQHWVDTPAENFGWVITGNEVAPGTAKRFDSHEHLDPGSRPRLTVSYVTIEDTITVAVTINSDWNMLSNPVLRLSASDSVRQLYPNSIFPFAYTFSPQTGYQSTFLVPRGGFWMKFPGTELNLISGYKRTLDSIDVSAGWNLVGSISFPVDTASVTSVPPNIKSSHWYGFAGSYAPSAQIVPGKAYWIRTNQAGRFILQSTGAASSARSHGRTDEIGE
jgi:hypothetical protein